MARGALAAALALLVTGCLTPPALFEVRGLGVEQARAEYPIGTAAVEIEVEDATLRGFFVPAGAGAPVVIHLLGSGASVVSPLETPAGAAFGLAGLGFASLLVDYAGVGASSGERDVDHLARDARAIFDAALARAGGDPQRVHVRATSIGTLATAALLASGARPASLVLIAPVTPASAVPRGAAFLYGDPVGVLAELLFRPVQSVALPDVLARAPATLVLAPDHDQFLWDRERAALRVAVESSGNTWRDVPGDHIGIAGLAMQLLPGEERWWIERADPARRAADLAALVEALSPADRARFDEVADAAARARIGELAGFRSVRRAKDVAACALAIDDPALSIATLAMESGQHADLDLADTAQCFSPDAPIRPLAATEVAALAALYRGMLRGGASLEIEPSEWWRYGEALARGWTMHFEFPLRGPVGGTLHATMRPIALAEAEDAGGARDAILRSSHLLLRAAGRAHRAWRDETGAWRLELRRGGAWVEIAPAAE